MLLRFCIKLIIVSWSPLLSVDTQVLFSLRVRVQAGNYVDVLGRHGPLFLSGALCSWPGMSSPT